MSDEARFITPNEAISLLKEGEFIHTFRNPAGILLGCDHNRESLIEKLNANPDKIQIGGETARRMGHAIILEDSGYLFIENDKDKLNEFDPV